MNGADSDAVLEPIFPDWIDAAAEEARDAVLPHDAHEGVADALVVAALLSREGGVGLHAQIGRAHV